MNIVLFVILGLMAPLGIANHNLSSNPVSYEYATVLDTQPIIESVRVVTPVEECWQERVSDRHGDHGVGLVVGAFVGGALGHVVGHKKKNKQVGAVLGSILGATLGIVKSLNKATMKSAS